MNTDPASSITRAASSQTYYTIRFLVDRDRIEDAYRSYAYFRWIDDTLDSASASGALPTAAETSERAVFLGRQKALLEECLQGRVPQAGSLQESMLVELIRRNPEKGGGLAAYLRNMMQVMEFDAGRRGRLVSEVELANYTRWLATAVTECIHYFIGHDCFTPHDGTRYLAVSAAHIVHMLRDTFDDARLGYYNIPRPALEADHIGPLDVESQPYRAWVKGRVLLARELFKAGKGYFARVQSARCRLACFAYIARFEWLLDTIEQEGYCLRPQYDERKTVRTGLRMGWLTLSSLFHFPGVAEPALSASSRPPGTELPGAMRQEMDRLTAGSASDVVTKSPALPAR